MLTFIFKFDVNTRNTSINRRKKLCLTEQEVYIDEQLVCETGVQGVKYLSYNPPGGGWNNQRVAFENAVVLAKLLNRTLIVHPLAPHPSDARKSEWYHKTGRTPGGYFKRDVYPRDKLLPLSKVIDLKVLSKLLPVKDFSSNHVEFVDKYKHLTWSRVCHNELVGIWVDAIPRKTDEEKWKLIRRVLTRKRLPSPIPSWKHFCELKQITDGSNVSSDSVWGIKDELSNRTEDMLYFAEGSLYNRHFHFFDKKTVLNAHKWTMRFIHFASDIRKRGMNVLEAIGRPFNAMHVRRTDHYGSVLFNQSFWLKHLKARKAQNLTKTLYIATDEKNQTWFRPFREAGYRLLFAEDFDKHFQFQDIDRALFEDKLGLCEQFICAHADIFVGSSYSTFSVYIDRLRAQRSWKKGMHVHYASVNWMGTNQ
ncbi:hypothetical protein OS493_028453 [Desmophyllum pertusum]|uniref:GDP-fucose protein O-fucosyltransferase 2 n=1 Tax=Desmophyllum pertusum TaxID=174260 RepID=A0A9W9ZLZ3_9CNID|nr:hypothetical protein OS493_028453 [Desmophyllum pertusum]